MRDRLVVQTQVVYEEKGKETLIARFAPPLIDISDQCIERNMDSLWKNYGDVKIQNRR